MHLDHLSTIVDNLSWTLIFKPSAAWNHDDHVVISIAVFEDNWLILVADNWMILVADSWLILVADYSI